MMHGILGRDANFVSYNTGWRGTGYLSWNPLLRAGSFFTRPLEMTSPSMTDVAMQRENLGVSESYKLYSPSDSIGHVLIPQLDGQRSSNRLSVVHQHRGWGLPICKPQLVSGLHSRSITSTSTGCTPFSSPPTHAAISGISFQYQWLFSG